MRADESKQVTPSKDEDPESIVAEGNVVLTKLRVLPPKQTVQATKTSDWSVLLVVLHLVVLMVFLIKMKKK